jgi:hypothetical protein
MSVLTDNNDLSLRLAGHFRETEDILLKVVLKP